LNEDKDWRKLSPYQHARLRTEMYFGARTANSQPVLGYGPDGPVVTEQTWVPAVFTAFREVLDNAVDEVVSHGHGDRIEIVYDEAKSEISISDNGRGIPINWDESEKNWAATVLLSETMAGRNFGDDRGATRGLNGVGASIVNFCSAWFRVEIERDRKRFEQMFREGEELVIEDAFIVPSTAKKTGTRISFRLSQKVFPDLSLPASFINARVRDLAICYPDLKVFLNGKRVDSPKGGPAALFPHHQPIPVEIEDGGLRARFWLVPKFVAEGEFSHGIVNAIPVFNGGVHVDAFRRAFFSGLLTALERENRKRKLVPNRSDIAEGTMLYSIVEMKAPSFDSQSKTRLISEDVAVIIRKTMADPELYKGIIKRHPEWIEAIYARCAERTQKKDLADVAKLAKQSKRLKVEDLEDAAGTDRRRCVLFLGEGRSAISGIVEARDPDIHGGLPLRGKILNVHGESIKTILANEALTKIMQSVGLVPGQRVNRHALRYGKIHIATDADEDGKNIAALLVNFFHTFWPDLFDPASQPFIYVFETPLIIAVKGKNRQYWHADDYKEFDPDKFKGWEITRAKGLAALRREDWRNCLANPHLRPIVDDGNLRETLDLLFNPSSNGADRRKKWIGL